MALRKDGNLWMVLLSEQDASLMLAFGARVLMKRNELECPHVINFCRRISKSGGQ